MNSQERIFAVIRSQLVQYCEMTPSPFHGIFSGFQEEEELKTPGLPIQDESTEVSSLSMKSGKQTGQIAVDIYEQDNYYVIRAPIAGVKLSDLDIEVDGKVITIRGSRSMGDDVPLNQYYLQECFWGEFSRSVTLPTVIDPKRVKATFSKDSILKVIVPKEDKVKIVRINEA